MIAFGPHLCYESGGRHSNNSNINRVLLPCFVFLDGKHCLSLTFNDKSFTARSIFTPYTYDSLPFVVVVVV